MSVASLHLAVHGSSSADRRSFGILSTYPPTVCGLATFTAALAAGLERGGARDVGVVRVSDGADLAPDDRVVTELRAGSGASIAAAAARLNQFDLVIVQHEYGIYGGVDGDDVVAVLELLTVPCVVVAHTVLHQPTAHQRSVLDAVLRLATKVVVMTAGAREGLLSGYAIDPDKILLIPHGASTGEGLPLPRPGARPYVLTWGLLGPGKGIEWMIDAMARVRDLDPMPRYIVAGRTHPKVKAAHGESYREMLVERAWHNGTAASVTFDPSYRDLPSLTTLVRGAAVVVLPYDSRDQATSGVLVDAIAAGRPVIATGFPHAVELLATGAGIIVPHGDPDALARALVRVFREPGLAASMRAEAARLAPELSWSAVAGRYASIADELVGATSGVAG